MCFRRVYLNLKSHKKKLNKLKTSEPLIINMDDMRIKNLQRGILAKCFQKFTL